MRAFYVQMNSDRDRAMDRLLGRAMAARSDAPGPDGCLGADTLAAWLDGTLAGPDREAAETHLSTCSRCQATIALAARTAEPEAFRERQRPRLLSARWLVPLTAAAAAVVLWVVVPSRQPSSVVQVQAPEPAQSVAEEKAEAQPTARPDAAATPPASLGARELQAPSSPERGAQQERLGAVRRDEAAVPAQPAEQRAADALAETIAPASPARSATVEIQSAVGSARWRVGRAGSIQRSLDGGASWEVLPSGVGEDLVAVAAPSPAVCWVVGRAGVVLLSAEGARFERLPFPERVDLVAVEATDGRTATVTAADGRLFRTSDAGRSWVR